MTLFNLTLLWRSLHPSLKHDRTPWVDAQERNWLILSFVTSTSILAPASALSYGGILRSEHQKPLLIIFFLNFFPRIFSYGFFPFFSICDLNKPSSTCLFNIQWAYSEISALKTLTQSCFSANIFNKSFLFIFTIDSFVCDLYKYFSTSLCPLTWKYFEIWDSKTLTKGLLWP